MIFKRACLKFIMQMAFLGGEQFVPLYCNWEGNSDPNLLTTNMRDAWLRIRWCYLLGGKIKHFWYSAGGIAIWRICSSPTHACVCCLPLCGNNTEGWTVCYTARQGEHGRVNMWLPPIKQICLQLLISIKLAQGPAHPLECIQSCLHGRMDAYQPPHNGKLTLLLLLLLLQLLLVLLLLLLLPILFCAFSFLSWRKGIEDGERFKDMSYL